MALESIPRGPVYRVKSGTVDVADNYERSIAAYRESAREEARRMHKLNQEVTQVGRYIRCLLGEGFYPDNYRRWRSRFVDNRLAKARVDHLAQLTDTRPVPEVTTQIEAFQQQAAVINNTLRYQWTRRDLDLKLVTAADIADCYGTGFWRIGAAKPGVMNVLACGPDQVMPIQPGFDLQESTAVLFRTWKAVQWIKRKFPFTTNGIEREIMNQPMYGTSGNSADVTFNRPSHIDDYTWNGLAPAMKRLLGVRGDPAQDPNIGQYFKTLEVEELFIDDPTTNDSLNTVIVRDPFLSLDQHNWWYEVKPGQPLFPRKRHMVFAGSRQLSDGPSPYWHGLYPFATLRFNPVFWSFWGLSKYRDLLPLNIAMNEIVAASMDLIKRALNPTSITKEGAVAPSVWREFYPDLPGMKLRVGANQSLADSLRYMDPPVIPPYVIDMLKGWLAPEFDRMSGSIDVQAMGGKKQVPGGDTLEQMRDSLQTSLRLEERMLEVFLRDAGLQGVSNVCQFWTWETRLRELGEMGLTPQDFNMDSGNMLPEDRNAQPDFWKQFACTVSVGSLHAGAKDREKQVAINLASRGLFPVKEMYRRIDIGGSPEATWQELLQEKVQAAQAAGAGEPPSPAPTPAGSGRQARQTRGQTQGRPA